MEKSLAEQYLDGDIEVEEYTALVMADGENLAVSDRANRAFHRIELNDDIIDLLLAQLARNA